MIEIHADEFAEAFALLHDELDFVAFGQFELLELLLRGQSGALDVVVADVALRCGGIGLRFRRQFGLHAFDAADAFPSGCTGRGGQFFDGNVFDLHEANAAAVHLRGDVAIERDVGVGFGVVHAVDAIDPGLDARAFGTDAVFVPTEDIDGLVERGLLLGRGCPDDFVAAVLVVNFAEPSRAAIDLITAHRPVLRPHAADLNAAIQHARLRIAADLDLELQLEVLIRLLRADEVVLLDLLRRGAAGDDAVLDTPHRGIKVPAIERFAVEEGYGLGVKDERDQKDRKEGEAHGGNTE